VRTGDNPEPPEQTLKRLNYLDLHPIFPEGERSLPIPFQLKYRQYLRTANSHRDQWLYAAKTL